MKSIFDLKTRNDEFSSSNQGLTNYKYQEVQSLKSVSGTNFADGQLVYRWTYGAQKYWIPNKSYVKITCKLTFPDSTVVSPPDTKRTQLKTSDDIAPVMNTAPNLFQSMQYKIADMMVSQVTENLAQVDTLKNRMSKSGHWLNTVGKSNNFWQSCYTQRLNEITPHKRGHHLTNPYKVFQQWISVELGATITDADRLYAKHLTNGNLRFEFYDSNTSLTRFLFRDAKAGDTNLKNTGPIRFGWKLGDIVKWNVTYAKIGAAAVDHSSVGYYTGTLVEVTSAGGANGFNILNTFTVKPFDFTAETYPTWAEQTIDVTEMNVVTSAVKLPESTIDFQWYRAECDFVEDARCVNEFELIWQPCLSVFDVQHAIPCAATKHELTFTPFPNTTYQKNVIESILADKNLGSDFNFEVQDMRLYLLTCDSNPVQDEMQFMLDLDEVHCQTSNLTSAQQQTSIDVVGSTNAITVAFQDEAACTNSLYSLSKFRIRDNIESKLERYYIRYEGQVPQPDFDGKLEYDATSNSKTDTLKDLYNRSLLYGGSYFKDSCETIQEFRERGMYMYHPFPKTASSRNTRVYTQTLFKDLEDINGIPRQPKLLLFQHYKKVVVCKIVNGRIVGVTPIDA